MQPPSFKSNWFDMFFYFQINFTLAVEVRIVKHDNFFAQSFPLALLELLGWEGSEASSNLGELSDKQNTY